VLEYTVAWRTTGTASITCPTVLW